MQDVIRFISKMPSAAASTDAGAPLGSLLLLVGGILAVVAALLGRSGFTGRDHGASALCCAVC